MLYQNITTILLELSSAFLVLHPTIAKSQIQAQIATSMLSTVQLRDWSENIDNKSPLPNISFKRVPNVQFLQQTLLASNGSKTARLSLISILGNEKSSVPHSWVAQVTDVDLRINTYLSSAQYAGNKNYWKNSDNPKVQAYFDFYLFFVELLQPPVRPYPNGIYVSTLSDGTTVTVRPFSTSTNSPTIEILRSGSSRPLKVRYLLPGQTLPKQSLIPNQSRMASLRRGRTFLELEHPSLAKMLDSR